MGNKPNVVLPFSPFQNTNKSFKCVIAFYIKNFDKQYYEKLKFPEATSFLWLSSKKIFT